MNNQLLEKIITTNNIPCPEFVYENPLLDSTVASALSKSFVKILNISQENSNVTNNLRLSILENIRKLCRIEPENHLKVDEKLTNLLTQAYVEKIHTSRLEEESIKKSLDAFLVRSMTSMNLYTQYVTSINPEIVQALLNLNQNHSHLSMLTQDIIHWDASNKHAALLKNIWAIEEHDKTSSGIINDVPIKLKSEIEKELLQLCLNILVDRSCKVEDIVLSNVAVKDLIMKSSNSAECFRLCSEILNSSFIMTNFDSRIKELIVFFIEIVKEHCNHVTKSVLYPIHMSHIVILMDFDINILPMELRSDYINSTLKYLSNLKLESDIILLLSHYPQWFDLYLNYKES